MRSVFGRNIQMGGALGLSLAKALIVILGLALAVGGWARDVRAETDEEIVTKINTYLRSLSTMSGSFIQIAPNGRISEGQFAIRRPGRMRFEYSPPDPTLLVVDGFWVALLDEENDRSIDRFPLSETPLNVFLREDVNLKRDGVISAVQAVEDEYRITTVDPDGDAQGELTLIFAREPLQLKQWSVRDAVERTTTIVLRAAEIGGPLANELFVIPEAKRRKGRGYE